MTHQRTELAFKRSIRTRAAVEGQTRTETDNIGSKQIPADAYWGINVSRALDNFAISGRPISIYPDFIFAYACVKQASARANLEIGILDPGKADLIDRVCEEIKDGQWLDQFVVDVIQGGAGTSTNMNVNEVIANRGLELAGHPRGAYSHLDPNDDVNKGQSTNDSYPSALKIGLCLSIERFLVALKSLEQAFHDKGREFTGILKVGRTQLMDAVPMTLEQEFESFSVTLAEDHAHLEALIHQLCEVNLGGTAIGTGIAADPKFPAVVRRHLADITGYDIRTAANLIEATTDVGVFMELSGALKRTAMKLSKICNDLRLLGSGPQAGFAEIRLPAQQAGSSIMPGKVNPVIPEVVNQVAFVVAGADVTISMAAEAGQLQLNAFEPIMAHSLFTCLQWMSAACTTLRENCVVGISANKERLSKQVGAFVGVITALIPHIGYANAAKLAKQALETNENVADMIVNAGLMTREAVTEMLSPEHLT
ncbi:MAG: aspartate ammonia-lyase [Pseudomonadota bacterium]|jgi:aspartate ammonia-lyase